jgi:hypothetical protein
VLHCGHYEAGVTQGAKMDSIEPIISTTKNTFKGNILLFYAFDVGDDIDLEMIKQKGLVNTCVMPLSAYFKNYHIPLAFRMNDEPQKEVQQGVFCGSCISSKVHHFGVLSFCYRIPFEDSFEDLKVKIIDIKKSFDEQSEVDAKATFKRIFSAIKKPRFYSLKNSYFALHVYPLKEKITPEEFKELYGSKIASLLRLEVYALSDYQMDEILASSIGYYGQDLIIVDSAASFIYDDEYFEPLEFFESANIQKLELQYFDRELDQKLNFFYAQKSYEVPFKAYIPLLGQRVELPVSRLAKMRVDISVVTERLENSIKMAGDEYYSKLYSMLVEKLSIKEWRDSIGRKLNIINDLYTVYQDRLDTIHEELLTIVVIILITFEAMVAFMR